MQTSTAMSQLISKAAAAVSGWIGKRHDFLTDWQSAGIKGDAFSLVWESADLIALHGALTKFMTQQAVSVSTQS